MLSEAELRLLAELRGERSVSALAAELDRSRSYTSELVSQVESTGVVETRKQGQTKFVSPAGVKAVELFQNITQRHGHVEWPSLLAGAALKVLYYLDTPHSVSGLETCAPVHRSTVYRVLEPLEHRGIVYKTENGAYALNEEFTILSQFARELAHQLHRATVDSHTHTYTLLWESVDEFLVQTPNQIDHENFHATGPAQFQAYGIPLLARERRYYLYSDTAATVPPEALCCHMLVIEKGTRTQSYCLLLLSHVEFDTETLRTQAEKYGVAEPIEGLLTYLKTRGIETTATLPTWDEFEALAEEYEVTV